MLWYHVSDEFIGYNPTFEPVENNSEGFELWFEGSVPRICVSNNIFFCIRSKIGSEDLRVFDLLSRFMISKREDFEEGNYIEYFSKCEREVMKNPAVYATDADPYYPPNASDFRRNNEMWFITPTAFQFIGFLSIGQMIKNHVVRLTNQQIEQIWIPDNVSLELNPFMDPLYNNNKFFYDTAFYAKNTEEGVIPLYRNDYVYPRDDEEIEKRLRELGVLK